MGRGNFISFSSIERLCGMLRHSQQVKERNTIIESQVGIEKDKPATFSLRNVDFNIDTRICRIEIQQSQQYRTIQKYVTRDYQKYPVYSEWKTRSKTIKKTIKLTNGELESLNTNSDPLIRRFADNIILSLKCEELFPAWFIIKYLRLELKEILKQYDDELNQFILKTNSLISRCKRNIADRKDLIDATDKQVNALQKKLDKQLSIVNKINNAKPNFAKYIFSFGIYAYLISKKRKNKISAKIKALSDEINDQRSYISIMEKDINKFTSNIENYNRSIDDKRKYISKSKTEFDLEIKKKIDCVEPLKNTVSVDPKFMPLKSISGLQYEKITGCYIIRNTENDKCYVGQSKDVLKRLKQHFKGTIPVNSIFAEDYYTSTKQDKENLFEVKIIRLNTKDELDKMEKQMIADYDSWNNGYNRTSGNI